MSTVQAYFEGINDERYDDVGALFAPDGVLIAPGRRRRGWARRQVAVVLPGGAARAIRSTTTTRRGSSRRARR